MVIISLKCSTGILPYTSSNAMMSSEDMVEISAAGLREIHVHDVIITKEAPNYRVDNA